MLHHPSALRRSALRRRTLLGAAASLPAAGMLAACSGNEDEPTTPDGPPDQVTYLTNFGTLGRDSYAWLALANGHFADANLDVTIEPGTGTEGNIRGLRSGQAQFATADLAGTAITRIEEEGFIAIAAIHQLPLGSVMAYEDSGITVPQDLPGRTVGLPPGALTELLFPTWLELAGVDVDEVEQVPLGPADLVSALAAGEVDAIGQFIVGRPLVEAAGNGQAVNVLPYDRFLGDLYGVGLCTTTELAEQDPQLCVRFRDALLAGLQDAIDDPEAAAEALAEHIPETNPEVAAAEMEAMAPYSDTHGDRSLGHIDEIRLGQHIALLSATGLLGGNPTLTPQDLVAFDLVPEQS